MADRDRIPFFKMHGGGNDFVLIDHRERFIPVPDQPRLAQRLCACKTGVGADGLILIEHSDKADLGWRFYNADGSQAEMCGNGARCAARFAVLNGLAQPRLSLETLAGVIHAEVQDRVARVLMTGVGEFRLHLDIPVKDLTLHGHFMKVGVPHTVVPVKNLEEVPVVEWGRAVRFHPMFQPAGTNCNFAAVTGPHALALRTYERGVEDETLACGTGAVAAALISARLGKVTSPVLVHTRGGEVLTVSFQAQGEAISEVFLEGEALVVYQGELWMEEIK
ncbi:MAG: diaminopimelate epimerase [Deltaproteobacteria bacterium]|nr:diaminopimelate epimerase [Deltaproteobacteria bacterium]